MRIAVVCDYFLDFVGGAQISIISQEHALTAADHQVSIISCTRDDTEVETPQRLLMRHSGIFPGVDLPVLRNRPPLRARIREYLQQNRIDIVHVQTEFGIAHATAAAARELGLPVVHTVHTFYWHTDFPLQPIVGLGVRALLRSFIGEKLPAAPLPGRGIERALRNMTLSMALRADAVVSPSAHQAADLRAAGVRAPLYIVPNPAALNTAEPARTITEPVLEPKIAWIGRLGPEKRPLEFVEAALGALHAGARFSVDIIGGGTLLNDVRKLAAKEPRIRTHGDVGHDAVAAFLDESAVLTVSSMGFDNQPMTISEAISRHRGIVYCDPRLEDGIGSAGLCSATPASSALQATLYRIGTEPELVPALSAAAAAAATEFSAEHYRERILEVYSSILR